MRAIAAVTLACALGVAGPRGEARAASASPSVAAAAERVAVYVEPPAAPPFAATARAAFAEAARRLGATFVDGSPRAAHAPSLVPDLEAARAEYLHFAFPAALARLDALDRALVAQGGGDLDARQISEVFFYRGLCRLETGAADAAWEDLVRAARLDPARVVDPARFAPRAVSAYERAVAEVARLPRAELAVAAPTGAAVRVDGAPATGDALAVTLGPHLLSIEAPGYERWAGTVQVTAARTRVAPPLVPWRAPDGDHLLALAAAAGAPLRSDGSGPPRHLLLGALEPTATGWRFLARDLRLPDGQVTSDAAALGDAPVAATVRALVARVAPPPATRRAWPYLVGAAALATVAAGLALGLTLGASTRSGTVGGAVGLP